MSRILIRKAADKWVYDKMMSWPIAHRPQVEYYHGTGEIAYNFVVGQTPRSWRTVWHLAESALWGRPDDPRVRPISRATYVGYVVDRALQSGIGDSRTHNVIKQVLNIDLTPVVECHGDMTMQNVIGDVFIDPGQDRGLPCRELDEAKLLQSCEGFCELYRGTRTPDDAHLMRPGRSVHVLLLTHYIRLLRHCPSMKEWTTQRIRTLTELLS